MRNTKVKKIVLIFLVISLIFFINANKIFAETGVKIAATGKIDNDKNTMTIAVETSDLQEIGEGINAYILTLNYNANQLEFETVSGENNWNSPSYNKESIESGKIKLVATRSDFSKDKGTILRIRLKLKSGISSKDIDAISLSDISFAYKQEDTTDKILVDDVQVKLDANAVANGSNSSQANNQNKIQENLPKTLPKAGIGKNIMAIIAMVMITSGIFIRYKSIKLK